MPWASRSPDVKRQADAAYQDPEYRRNKAIVRRRSGGRCEVTENGQRCTSRKDVQCDHVIAVARGGTHALANLQDACGYHHRKKTATEGGGYRAGNAAADPAPTPRTAW